MLYAIIIFVSFMVGFFACSFLSVNKINDLYRELWKMKRTLIYLKIKEGEKNGSGQN